MQSCISSFGSGPSMLAPNKHTVGNCSDKMGILRQVLVLQLNDYFIQTSNIH